MIVKNRGLFYGVIECSEMSEHGLRFQKAELQTAKVKGFVFPVAQSGLSVIDSVPECYARRASVKYLCALFPLPREVSVSIGNMTDYSIPPDSWTEDDRGQLQRGAWRKHGRRSEMTTERKQTGNWGSLRW